MSIPTAVFLDTSVLDGLQYNFQTTALATFVPACVARSVTLLLPECTEREIMRHIEEWSKQAAQALEDARRKAPMLAKWAGMPKDARSLDTVKSEVHLAAYEEWTAFLKHITLVRLGYDGVDLKRVMVAGTGFVPGHISTTGTLPISGEGRGREADDLVGAPGESGFRV